MNPSFLYTLPRLSLHFFYFYFTPRIMNHEYTFAYLTYICLFHLIDTTQYRPNCQVKSKSADNRPTRSQ